MGRDRACARRRCRSSPLSCIGGEGIVRAHSRDGRRQAPAKRMKCFRCKQDNPAHTKYCGECGVRLQLQSQLIKAYSPPRAEEAIHAPDAPQDGERKRVTVMFADLENSMS